MLDKLSLDVVFLVLVQASTRAFAFRVVLVDFRRVADRYRAAATVPMQVWSKGRRRKEHFNARVFMATQGLIRIVNLLSEKC